MKKRARPLFDLLWIVLLVLLLYLAFRDVAPADVWRVLRRSDPLYLGGYLALNGLLALFLANRWWLILHGLGVRLPYWQIAGFRLIGATISMLTPGPQVGGEPAQIHLLRRQGAPAASAVASVTLDKTIELLANFGFLATASLFVLSAKIFHADLGWTAPVVALLLLALPAALLVALWQGRQPLWALLHGCGVIVPALLKWRLWPRLVLVVTDAERDIHRLLAQRPGHAAMALAVSCFNWLLLVGEFWLATWILQMGLSFGEVIAMLVAARLAFLLPMPAGLGTLEAGQVFTLVLLGYDPAAGVSLSLLMRLRDLMLILVSIFLAWRQGWLRQGQPLPAGEDSPAVLPSGGGTVHDA